MTPTFENIICRDNQFCKVDGEVQACNVYGAVAYTRPLDGLTQSRKGRAENLEFCSPHLDKEFPYCLGLVHIQEGYACGPDYHLISNDPHQILEFFKNNSLNRGFTIQFAVSTKRGVVLEVFKKGKMTLKAIKTLLDMGFDQWFYSGCWAPKWFLIGGEIVPLAGTLDLTTGKDVNPWLKALYGREVPNDAGFSLKINSIEHIERMK